MCTRVNAYKFAPPIGQQAVRGALRAFLRIVSDGLDCDDELVNLGSALQGNAVSKGLSPRLLQIGL